MEDEERVQIVQVWVSSSLPPKKRKKEKKKEKKQKLPLGFTPNKKKEPDPC